MDRKYACYCGIHCENCDVKVKVEPASKVLYKEMQKLGFDEIMSFFPDGEKFWSFLKSMSTEGICISCKAGSGNPTCKVRICAKEKNVEMCAFCESYPCEHITELFEGYSSLKHDNSILREKGWESWEKLQEERKAKGVGLAYVKDTNE
ncbi:DUF3795 domain-containing protein [Bacteroidales bacterium OttesenSCG-928-K03]|nr:DUF3795 domain-containing protein [Bacteroidales bacterium OttesenSCG-928-K03]